jgi:hypothetical protein
MACPWPNEVLATPLCAPVYVKVAPGFINKSNSPSGLGSPGAKAKLAKVRVSCQALHFTRHFTLLQHPGMYM